MHTDDQIFSLLGKLPLMLPAFALVLFRISGLAITAPVFGSELLAPRIRIGLAVVISFVMFPLVATSLPPDLTLASAIAGVFGELLIGLIMGLSLSLLFVGVELAGMVIGQQAGLSLGQVFDPVTGNETTTIGQVFLIVAMTLFVIAGGHRELLRCLLDTYATVPPMSFRFDASMLELLTDLLSGAFVLALRLAGPVLISLMLASLVMGFLSRTMPQLNILSVGFIVRALLAIGAAGLAITSADAVLIESISAFLSRIREAFALP